MFLAEEMNGDLLNHLVVTQTMILIQSVQWSDATQKCSHANDHFSRKWLAEMNNNLQCNEFFIDSNRKLPLLSNRTASFCEIFYIFFIYLLLI